MSDNNDSKIKNLIKNLYSNKKTVDKNLEADSRAIAIFGAILALINLFVFFKLDMTEIGFVVSLTFF